MSLTRDDFLSLNDVAVMELTIPDRIPIWGGKTIHIKQLTRAQQDAYLKRRYGDVRMKNDSRAQQSEILSMNVYGHDAWLCVQGCCDADGKPLFSEKDIDAINQKSGEVVGWIAFQVVKYSELGTDERVARGEITPQEALADELKN